ncbi:hypothetical protein AB0K02_13255 [Streptomyces sp. NPDC049597]|uniref:hypothetical protein n=1 Tax=Streptomyces sp. NPDC049597 TaxID=3155276 RepID=UPI00343122B5
MEESTVRLPLNEAAWIRAVRTDPVAEALVSAGYDVSVDALDAEIGPAPEWALGDQENGGEGGLGLRLGLGYRIGGTLLCTARIWLPRAVSVPQVPALWPLRRWDQPLQLVDDLRCRMPYARERARFGLRDQVPVLEMERTGVTLTGRVTDQMLLVLPADRVVLGQGSLRMRRSAVPAA